MKIKKTAKKAFHNGNRLNGDGGKLRATYGVFSGSEQVGHVIFTGLLWDAYDFNSNRLNGYGAPSLANLKKQLAEK